MTPNRVESGEIFQTTFLFFYFVPQCNQMYISNVIAKKIDLYCFPRNCAYECGTLARVIRHGGGDGGTPLMPKSVRITLLA